MTLNLMEIDNMNTQTNTKVSANRENVIQILLTIMKEVLLLGQSSLPEHQYEAFRTKVMDYFAEGKRVLGKGWCGDKQGNSKKGGAL